MEQNNHLEKAVYTDKILHFILGNNIARGRIIRLKDSYIDALKNHHYPHKINELLGHTAALGMLLTSSVKEEGLFTLQLQAQEEAAMRLLVAEMTGHNSYRLTARFNEEYAKSIEKAEILGDLFGQNGIMIFTSDLSKGERYQGVAGLNKETLAEAATEWLATSDQVESLLDLRTAIDEADKQGHMAFGLLIQPLATQDLSLEEQEKHKEEWQKINIFAKSLKDEEALDENLSLGEILYRLFNEIGVKLTHSDDAVFACRCSKERFMDSILNMKGENLDELAVGGIIGVKCEYCGMEYEIHLKELKEA